MPPRQSPGTSGLYTRISRILESARNGVARTVNTTQVVANWLVGREIVEEEQKGRRRATYGIKLLESLAQRLKKDFGDGYSIQNLRYMRQFYLGYLLKYILGQHDLAQFKEVLVFTDSIPIQKKRSIIEKAIKTTLAGLLPPTACYRLLHHSSKSNLDLQIADYCTWALYRKWNTGDARSYEHIKPAVTSEFDIFRTGTTHYY